MPCMCLRGTRHSVLIPDHEWCATLPPPPPPPAFGLLQGTSPPTRRSYNSKLWMDGGPHGEGGGGGGGGGGKARAHDSLQGRTQESEDLELGGAKDRGIDL